MHDISALRPIRTGLQAALYDNASLFNGCLRVVAFGRPYDYQEQDWTFRNLQRPDDGKKVDCSITRHLPTIAKEMDVSEILVPFPDFSGKICYQTELTVTIPVGDRLVLRRGVRADGCRLTLGQTYGISVGGCPVVVALYPRDPSPREKVLMVVAHAGFDSLFDRKAVLGSKPSKKPASVVSGVLAALGCSGNQNARRKRVQAVILFPLSPTEFTYPWDHQQFGADNEKICEFLREEWGESCVPGNDGKRNSKAAKLGKIDLAELITLQFAKANVPIEHIALLRTADVCDHLVHTDQTPMWYTTRRPFAPTKRNLLLVQRIK